MTEDQLTLLKQKLNETFVPNLPPLLDLTKPAEHMHAKNTSRAFSAFVIHKIAMVDELTAAQCVVDDYEDNGLDAIYYHQPTKKLFLVQSKLKVDDPFSLGESNSFIKGVKDLLNQYFDRFNINVQNRQTDLDIAIDEAVNIVMVVAHTAPIFSEHAKDAINEFLNDPSKPDERLDSSCIDYGPQNVLEDLLSEQAIASVDDDLFIYGHQKIDTGRVTYYGQVAVTYLAELYEKHGNKLLDRNIRYFLGVRSSEVNKAIYQTLNDQAENFFYLSNGVTAIADSIEIKGPRDGGRRFEIKGLSVINGAQTIASCHHFIKTNPAADLSAARVLITLIQVNRTDVFSKTVTLARNHQNPVSSAQFAALDDTQERLRRELAFNNITYRYRPEARTVSSGVDIMTIEEASFALALFHANPIFAVTLKREPSKLLDKNNTDYAQLFNARLSGKKLANAVRVYREATKIIASNELSASGLEKLIYRHGRHVIIWLTLSTSRAWLDRADIMTQHDAATLLSRPLDAWREKVHTSALSDLAIADKGPLAFFRNLTSAVPFVVKLRNAGI